LQRYRKYPIKGVKDFVTFVKSLFSSVLKVK
jgi:hypothetical protein